MRRLNMDLKGILQVANSSALIYPQEEKVRETDLGSMEAFEKLLSDSQKNPAAFWEQVAKELVWYERWQEVIKRDLAVVEYFVGGVSNPCVNLGEGHIEDGAGNRTALSWESEDGDAKFYTYNMLLSDVNRFANVLSSFGVTK